MALRPAEGKTAVGDSDGRSAVEMATMAEALRFLPAGWHKGNATRSQTTRLLEVLSLLLSLVVCVSDRKPTAKTTAFHLSRAMTCRCMVRAFGKTMAVLPELGEGDPLPSPESLRGKIVIKGKVVRDGEVRAYFVFSVHGFICLVRWPIATTGCQQA